MMRRAEGCARLRRDVDAGSSPVGLTVRKYSRPRRRRTVAEADAARSRRFYRDARAPANMR